MPKEKLTLSVDEEVVKKAKKLGINISEITEKVLKGFTFSRTDAEESQIRAKYKELFDTMLPFLQKYNVTVEVASVDMLTPEDRAKVDRNETKWFGEVELCPDGTLYLDEIDDKIEIENISLHEFASPKEILSRFIDAISGGSEKLQENIKELEMVKRIIAAIAEPVGKTPKRKK